MVQNLPGTFAFSNFYVFHSTLLNKHDIGRGPVPLKLSPYFHLIIATMQGLDGLDREERKWGVEAQGHQADA